MSANPVGHSGGGSEVPIAVVKHGSRWAIQMKDGSLAPKWPGWEHRGTILAYATKTRAEKALVEWRDRRVRYGFKNPAGGDGIKFVLGILKRGGKRVSEVQSVIFDKLSWTVDAAKQWLKDHGFKVPSPDAKAEYLRFRQKSPARYKEFSTIEAGHHTAKNPLGGPRGDFEYHPEDQVPEAHLWVEKVFHLSSGGPPIWIEAHDKVMRANKVSPGNYSFSVHNSPEDEELITFKGRRVRWASDKAQIAEEIDYFLRYGELHPVSPRNYNPSSTGYSWSSPEAAKLLDSLPDRALSKRLDIVRSQMTLAFEQKNDRALVNLQAQESAVIQARLRKFDRRSGKSNPSSGQRISQGLYEAIQNLAWGHGQDQSGLSYEIRGYGEDHAGAIRQARELGSKYMVIRMVPMSGGPELFAVISKQHYREAMLKSKSKSNPIGLYHGTVVQLKLVQARGDRDGYTQDWHKATYPPSSTRMSMAFKKALREMAGELGWMTHSVSSPTRQDKENYKQVYYDGYRQGAYRGHQEDAKGHVQSRENPTRNGYRDAEGHWQLTPEEWQKSQEEFGENFFTAGGGFGTTIQSARSRVRKWQAEVQAGDSTHARDLEYYTKAIEHYEKLKAGGRRYVGPSGKGRRHNPSGESVTSSLSAHTALTTDPGFQAAPPEVQAGIMTGMDLAESLSLKVEAKSEDDKDLDEVAGDILDELRESREVVEVEENPPPGSHDAHLHHRGWPGSGTKVRVAGGSGVESGKTGVVVPRSAVRFNSRGVPELPGEYKPWDAKRQREEVFVQLDSGSIISMYRTRLAAENPSYPSYSIQEWYETSSGEAHTRANEVRKLGYKVTVSSMGAQVTPVGTVKMMMVNIRPGTSGDKYMENVPEMKVERMNPESLSSYDDPRNKMFVVPYHSEKDNYEDVGQLPWVLIHLHGFHKPVYRVGRMDPDWTPKYKAVWHGETPAPGQYRHGRGGFIAMSGMFVDRHLALLELQHLSETRPEFREQYLLRKGREREDGIMENPRWYMTIAGLKRKFRSLGVTVAEIRLLPGPYGGTNIQLTDAQGKSLFETQTTSESDFQKELSRFVKAWPGVKVERMNPITGDLGQAAFDAAKDYRVSGAYYESGVANARVARYGFIRWYNDLAPSLLEGQRKSTLEKNWMEGWAAGKRVEKRGNPPETTSGTPAYRAGWAAYFSGYARNAALNQYLKSLKGVGLHGKLVAKREFIQGWDAVAAAALGEVHGKRNPEEAAAALSEEFHGRPAETVTTVTEEIHEHEYLTELGQAINLKVRTLSGYDAMIEFPKSGSGLVRLACSENGRQLYLVGGDQDLDLAALHMDGDKWLRDKVKIGQIKEISYQTAKGFDDFKLVEYFHHLGEVTKVKPDLIYDTLNKTLEIVGGQYSTTSRGLEN